MGKRSFDTQKDELSHRITIRITLIGQGFVKVPYVRNRPINSAHIARHIWVSDKPDSFT